MLFAKKQKMVQHGTTHSAIGGCSTFLFYPIVLHVRNIYQHLPHKSPSFVGKYTIHGAYGYAKIQA